RAERRERRRCRVRLAAGAQELEPDGAADELGEQSCLACSRLPNELHGATLAKAGRFERLAERRERCSTSPVTRISPFAARAVSRAARLTASPITAYVRRDGEPIGPASTWPRFTPTEILGPACASTIARTARSIRSSSSPPLAGAPATRYSLPPSRSISDSSQVIARSSASDETTLASAPSAAVASSRPSTSVSVPENLTNATVARRCSASTADFS